MPSIVPYPPPMPSGIDVLAMMWRSGTVPISPHQQKQFFQSITYYDIVGTLPSTTTGTQLYDLFSPALENEFVFTFSGYMHFFGWQWYWTNGGTLYARNFQTDNFLIGSGLPCPSSVSACIHKFHNADETGPSGRFWLPQPPAEVVHQSKWETLFLGSLQDFADALNQSFITVSCTLVPVIFRPKFNDLLGIDHHRPSPNVTHLQRRSLRHNGTVPSPGWASF